MDSSQQVRAVTGRAWDRAAAEKASQPVPDGTWDSDGYYRVIIRDCLAELDALKAKLADRVDRHDRDGKALLEALDQLAAETARGDEFEGRAIAFREDLASAVARVEKAEGGLRIAEEHAEALHMELRDVYAKKASAEAERDALQKVATTWQEHSYNLEAKLASARAGENGP